MGRNVSQIGGAREWYVVDVDDNRKDPDPFRVLISPLTGAEMRIHDEAGLNIGGSVMQRVNFVMDELVSKHVHEVQGYRVINATTGEMQEPKDGATLVACVKASYESEMRVLQDIVVAIKQRSHLAEGILKKSQPLLDSGQTATPALGSGVAASVAEPSEPTQRSTSTIGDAHEIAIAEPTDHCSLSSIQP